METAKTYFLTIKVKPSTAHKDKDSVGGAFASCWVVEESPEAALERAKQYLIDRFWDIQMVEKEPMEILAEQCVNDDFGFAFFEKSQKDGISISMAIWPKGENNPT